jgi:hypothetical protein
MARPFREFIRIDRRYGTSAAERVPISRRPF